MSNSTPPGGAGASPVPPSVAFDPSLVRAEALRIEPVGTVVLLLTSTRDLRWAAAVAIELSTAWARGGRRIVLADLHLENPVLHEQVGATNLEGVVDVFLYGASIARSARPVRGRGFYLISAGTYEPDAEAIYQHPRWPKLIAGFRDADASLVLFAPADSVDLEAVSRWAAEVVVLGPAEGALGEAIVAAGLPVRASLVPPRVDARVAPAADADSGAPAAEPTPAASAPDRELDLPPAPVRERPARRRGARVLVLLLLAAAAVAAAGYWLARSRPDLLPWTAARGATPGDSAAAPAAAAPTRTGDPLAYSVQVVAYSTLQDAEQQLARLRRRVPDVPFFIAPEPNQDVLYFKIRAGYLADTASAARLKERLLEEGVVSREDARGVELVRYAPLSFDLGEFSSEADAAARADSLMARGVPAYAVEVPYSDGSRRWQLYAGAYANSAGAEVMGRQLSEAGMEPKPVLRVGRPAPAPPVDGA